MSRNFPATVPARAVHARLVAAIAHDRERRLSGRGREDGTGVGRPPSGGRAVVLRTEPRHTGSRPFGFPSLSRGNARDPFRSERFAWPGAPGLPTACLPGTIPSAPHPHGGCRPPARSPTVADPSPPVAYRPFVADPRRQRRGPPARRERSLLRAGRGQIRPRAAMLTVSVRDTTTWSSSRTSTSSRRFFTRLVRLTSSGLGSAVPEGWLW